MQATYCTDTPGGFFVQSLSGICSAAGEKYFSRRKSELPVWIVKPQFQYFFRSGQDFYDNSKYESIRLRDFSLGLGMATLPLKKTRK